MHAHKNVAAIFMLKGGAIEPGASSARRAAVQPTDGGESSLVMVIVADAPHTQVVVEGGICGRAWKRSRRSHGSHGPAKRRQRASARARTDYRVALDAFDVFACVHWRSVVEVLGVHVRACLLSAPQG